ncbi:hypothetical protein Tco_0685552 [Tanacetum coccineum]
MILQNQYPLPEHNLDKMPREGLAIIESKSKVRYSRSRLNDSRAITNAPSSTSLPSNNSFKIQQMAALLEEKMNIRMSHLEKAISEKQLTPATVKAVEEVCVTCGSNQNFKNCPLTRNDFPVFHDNIHQFQPTAAVGNFVQNNQGNRNPILANKIRPPGFNHLNPPLYDETEEVEDVYLNVVIRSNRQRRYFSTLMAVLSILDRDDICAIYQLVMNIYQDETPEGFDKILWGDLIIMFNQKSKYPLKKEVLSQLIELKLENEEDSTMALELIRFVKKQIGKTLTSPKANALLDVDVAVADEEDSIKIKILKEHDQDFVRMFGYILQEFKKNKLKKHEVKQVQQSLFRGEIVGLCIPDLVFMVFACVFGQKEEQQHVGYESDLQQISDGQSVTNIYGRKETWNLRLFSNSLVTVGFHSDHYIEPTEFEIQEMLTNGFKEAIGLNVTTTCST